MRAHSLLFPRERSLGDLARLLFATLVLFLVNGVCAYAQDSDEPQEAPQALRPRDEEINFLRLLNLTPEQVGQLRGIRQQSELEGRPLMRRLNQARRALDEAIYADDLDEAAIRERAREVAEVQVALFRLRAMSEVKVRRVLTPEQLQKFRELRREAQARRQLERRNQRMQQQGNALNPRQNPRLRNAPNNSNNNLPPARRRNSLNRP
jgi:Spy/CpxP family protein refolding chaperone